jgi:hypothetical protein
MKIHHHNPDSENSILEDMGNLDVSDLIDGKDCHMFVDDDHQNIIEMLPSVIMFLKENGQFEILKQFFKLIQDNKFHIFCF